MPSYTMKNTKTNETKEMVLSLQEREEFLKNNSDWVQLLSTPKIVSGLKGALARSDDGWKENLKRIKKGSARNNTINV